VVEEEACCRAEDEAGKSNFGSITNRSKALLSIPGAVMTIATLARVFCRSGVCREDRKKLTDLNSGGKMSGD
jgi:hypothetical protein